MYYETFLKMIIKTKIIIPSSNHISKMININKINLISINTFGIMILFKFKLLLIISIMVLCSYDNMII